MSRAPLTACASLLLGWVLSGPAAAQSAASLDPHLDSIVVRSSCQACHRGHGAARSPMLPGPQREVCLGCHGTRADVERQVREGALAADARPPLLASALSRTFTHPLTARAFSELEPAVVVCSSCHSPHRGDREQRGERFPPARRLMSPKDPSQFEYQLCEGCHGRGGAAPTGLTNIGGLVNPANRSYHPVEAPTRDGAPSVRPELAGREVNCTDCHGNADPLGARGPHGSSEQFLLRARYATVDGSGASASAHALCWLCHRQEALLDSPRFPLHRLHVGRLQASCATCHNPHGSERNRALMRFGEESFVAGVSPSILTGRLEYVSDAPGSGTCYLTCHGRDHAGEPYGTARLPTDRPPRP